MTLQEGNNLPRTLLQTGRSRELADNRIGGLWSNLWEPYDWEGIFDEEIINLGLKRVRLAISSMDIPHLDWSKPEFVIDPSHDNLITNIADDGVAITYNLIFWDTERGSEGRTNPRFKQAEEIQRYLEFVRFIVHHFRGRVQAYEVWNEPNIGDPIQAIEVEDYISLVRQVVPVIREEDPEARIVIGAITPLVEPNARDYLFSILNSDLLPSVDAISWHVGAPSPEYEEWRQYYYEYPSLVQEIKNVATAHGFHGEFVADELNWRTPANPFVHEPWTFSEIVSTKYYARGIVMHLGMDVSVGLAEVSASRQVFFSTIQNLCTLMAGARPISLPIEIQSESTNVVSHSFSLPNGDHLTALWTDIPPVEEDLGAGATLIIPGLSGKLATGIDVLHDFEQELTTSNEGENLVIRDMRIKDYPIFIRISD